MLEPLFDEMLPRGARARVRTFSSAWRGSSWSHPMVRLNRAPEGAQRVGVARGDAVRLEVDVDHGPLNPGLLGARRTPPQGRRRRRPARRRDPRTWATAPRDAARRPGENLAVF